MRWHRGEAQAMNGYIGITDNEWFAFLSEQEGIDEVNFWQPSGKTLFGGLRPGEPFLFKLHAPHHLIVGGGYFAHSTILPISLAWDAFQEKNGAKSLVQMRRRTEKYRRTKPQPGEDYTISCVILTQPFFSNGKSGLQYHPTFIGISFKGSHIACLKAKGACSGKRF